MLKTIAFSVIAIWSVVAIISTLATIIFDIQYDSQFSFFWWLSFITLLPVKFLLSPLARLFSDFFITCLALFLNFLIFVLAIRFRQ